MNRKGGNMVLWFVIVVVVIGALIFLTLRKSDSSVSNESQVGQVEESTNNNNENNNMQNINEVEGLKITVIKEGTGEPVKSRDTVAMNYTGTLTDGTVFDSNVDPKFNHVEPFVFTIDSGMVIKGWDLGVAGMKVGEKRNLVIGPDLGYGAAGRGGIPPNATLNFEVELVGVQKAQ